MKVTLFGATGKTGPSLVNEGLQRGFELTVFARSSSKFENANVQIVRGEFTDIDLLRDAIRGSDAVLSALGPARQPHPKGMPITTATRAIISAMEREQVKRFIAVSTGTAADPGDDRQATGSLDQPVPETHLSLGNDRRVGSAEM